MGWKVSCLVEERMRFVTRLEFGERMSDLCLEFGISRKTGYKIWNRYKENGASDLFNRSSRPHYLARSTSKHIEKLILGLKKEYKTWGASKLLSVLQKNHPHLKFPVRATVHSILDRHGLVKKRFRRKYKSCYPTNLSEGYTANDVWCADYKGQFKMKNQQYCYPLTITDFSSRYLLGCHSYANTRTSSALHGFYETFSEFGIPNIIRTDNGVPFASHGLLGLSQLSVWWIRLGIRVEHTRPGCPQDNGRHERMHLTLKQDLTIKGNLLQQQEQLDDFRDIYNNKRPHGITGNAITIRSV